MKILDLFAGKGGELRRAKIEAMGHTYITLDIDPKFGCNITADIMTVNDLGLHDFIWASVPCETWSVASIGHHWNIDNTPKTKEAEYMVGLVKHTLSLLCNSGAMWVIENPRGKLRKMDFMQSFRRETVTYCQYGENRMKPTDLWISRIDWTPRPMCKNGDTCHASAPRGSRTGTQGMKNYADKSVVPFELWNDIISAIEATMKARTEA